MSGASGAWERRIAATTAHLTVLARRWTVERGFNGFTIDELCSAVGISRRTFFNYFDTNEDVVLGVPVHADQSDAEAAFLAAPRVVSSNGLSNTLLLGLAELLIARWEAFGLGAQDFDALVEAMAHAPRLLGRALHLSREQERGDIALVAVREGLPAGDLRASTVVHLLGSLLRGAVEKTFAGSDHEPLRIVFARRPAAARDVSCL